MNSGSKMITGTFVVFAMVAVVFSAGDAPVAADKSAGNGKPNIAVMTLRTSSGINEGEAGLITDRLRGELFNTGRANVMEREQMQAILKEQGFQQSGACSDEACLVSMGQLLGVQAIISGSIGRLGKMYLVNLRVIDITTGRITSVVSEDINGEIEGVVGRLPSIAAKLVGSPAPAAAPAPVAKPEPVQQPAPGRRGVKAPAQQEVVTPPPQKTEPIAVQVAIEPAPVQVATEPVPVQTAVVDGNADERNRNRGGMRFFYEVYPGTIAKQYEDPYYGGWIDAPDFDSLYEAQQQWGYIVDITHTPPMHFGIKFAIRAGNFLTIDVGPGFSFAREVYAQTKNTYDTTFESKERFVYVTPQIALGLNFVKRWAPLKVNAGIVADMNFNFVSYGYDETIDIISTYYYNFTYINDMNFIFNVAFGPRIGAEIMLGSHMGLNADIIYRFNSTIEAEFDYDDDVTTTPTPTKFRIPGFGIGAGLNVYF